MDQPDHTSDSLSARNAESLERNAAANESTAASSASANERAAVAQEQLVVAANERGIMEQAESQDRMDRAARHEVRTDRVDNRNERVNGYRRWVTYFSPVLFLVVVVLAIFMLDRQQKRQNEIFVKQVCSNVSYFHQGESERRKLAYRSVLTQFEAEVVSKGLSPAAAKAGRARIEGAYKPFPKDPACEVAVLERTAAR